MKWHKEEVESLVSKQVWLVASFFLCVAGFVGSLLGGTHGTELVLARVFTILGMSAFGFTAFLVSLDIRQKLLDYAKAIDVAWREMNVAMSVDDRNRGDIDEFARTAERAVLKLFLLRALEDYQLLQDVPPVGGLSRWNEYKSEDARRHDALAVLKACWERRLGNAPDEFTVGGADDAICHALLERDELRRAVTGSALAMSEALDLLLRYLADIGGLCFLTKPKDVTAKWLQNLRLGALMRALAIADFMERELKKFGRDEQIRARVPRGALADIMSAMNTGRQTGATAEALHYGHRVSDDAKWPAATNAWLASSGPSPVVNPGEELQFLAEWVFQSQTEDGWWKNAMPFNGPEGDGAAFDEWRHAQTATGLFWNPRNPRSSR